MKKQQNNSTRAWALRGALSIALLSMSAVLLASSFNAATAASRSSAFRAPTARQVSFPDFDGDGIPDSLDNCPTIPIPVRRTPMAMVSVMHVITAQRHQMPTSRTPMATGSVMHVITARPYQIPVRRTAMAMVLATRVNPRPSRSPTPMTAARARSVRRWLTLTMATRSISILPLMDRRSPSRPVNY